MTEETAPAPVPDPFGVTSLHARRAVAGDGESLEWMVRRLAPLLRAHAAYRLKATHGLLDPDDLVQDAWLRTLPRLEDLQPRDGRITPVLLRFLTTIVNRRVRDLLQGMLRGGGADPTGETPEPSSDHSGVVTQAIRAETRGAVQDALARLDPADREVIVLRGIEQSPLEEVAVLLGTTSEAARKRYGRALQRLRALVPGSVFDELPEST